MGFVPDIATRTTGADTRRKVLLALTVAYVVRTSALIKRDSEGTFTPKTVYDALLKTNVPAWVIVYALLAIASDFDATRELSLAFAILILVAVFLYDGGRFLAFLESITDTKTAKPKAKKKTAKKDKKA